MGCGNHGSGSSVNMLTRLSIYGRTYAIYSRATNKLGQLHLTLKMASSKSHKDPTYVAEFVQNVEAVFKEEVDLWIQQVEKSVAEIEQEISHKLPQQVATPKSDPQQE